MNVDLGVGAASQSEVGRDRGFKLAVWRILEWRFRQNPFSNSGSSTTRVRERIANGKV